MTEQEELAILHESLVQIIEALGPMQDARDLPLALTRIERASRPVREANLLGDLVARARTTLAQLPMDDEAEVVIALTLAAVQGNLPDWAQVHPDLN